MDSLPSGGATRSTSSGLVRPTPTKRASGDGRPPRGDFETASRWPSFQGLDLFNGTQVAWHDFRAFNFWLDKSWYPCLKQLCLRGVDHKIFSELARQWAKQCTRLWRLRSHLDTVQPQLGTTEGVQVNGEIIWKCEKILQGLFIKRFYRSNSMFRIVMRYGIADYD